MTLVEPVNRPGLLVDVSGAIPVYRQGGALRAWTYVDLDDYEAVNARRWHLHKGYPQTVFPRHGGSGSGRLVKLHRFLLGPPPDGLLTDHHNRVKLDNRRSNLRFVTTLESVRNSDSLGAINGRKTHCKYGHPLTSENVYRRPDGYRDCQMCRRRRERASRRRRRGGGAF